MGEQDMTMTEQEVTIAEQVSMASLQLDGHCQHSEYQYNKEYITTIMAELEGFDTKEDQEQRKPLDLVIVLDRSGSMHGAPLELCKSTCEFFSKEMSPKDRLALVTYDTTVKKEFGLTKMDEIGKQKVESCVKRIRPGNSTNLSGGLLEGIDILRQENPAEDNAQTEYLSISTSFSSQNKENDAKNEVPVATPVKKNEEEEPERIQAVLLLTDGFANAGVSNPEMLVNLTKDALSKVKGEPKLFTFGYGQSHDSNLLESLANCADGCRYFYVEQVDDVAGAFSDCLGGLLSIVAQNLKMTITGAGGAKLIGQPMTKFKVLDSSNSNEYKIEIPDMYAEEKRHLLFKVQLPILTATVNDEEDAPIAKIRVDFADCCTGKLETKEIIVGVKRPADITDKEFKEAENEKVSKQLLRYEAVEALEQAKKEAESGNLTTGRNRLFQMRERIQKDKYYDQGGMLNCLADDLMETEDMMQNTQRWTNEGSKTSQNLISEHYFERCYQSKAHKKSAYRNTTQHAARAKATTFFASKSGTVPPPPAPTSSSNNASKKKTKSWF